MAAPKGNKFASHDKPWTNALQRVLTQLEVKDADGKVVAKAGEALRLIAEVTVQRAIAGDKDARKEIADRMDGKPSEFLNVNHSRDPAEMSTDELAAEILRERANQPGPSQEQPSKLH
jgi:hypothetical protein